MVIGAGVSLVVLAEVSAGTVEVVTGTPTPVVSFTDGDEVTAGGTAVVLSQS